MKFPRNARIFRGPLDVAPFASVFFLLIIFLMIASLVYTPGVRLEIPSADDLPGVAGPRVTVAVDGNGRLYFENQWIEENELRTRLRLAVTNSEEPLTLVVQPDKAVTYEMLVHLALVARDAGIAQALLAILPSVSSSAATADP